MSNPTPRTPPRNSVAAMGFEAKFNADYWAYATATQTPFQVLASLFDQGFGDSAVGRRFDRRPQTAGKWRGHYDQLKTLNDGEQ